jgi:hypothetical protein
MTDNSIARYDEMLALGMDTTFISIPGGWRFVTTIKDPEHGTLVPEFVALTLALSELI